MDHCTPPSNCIYAAGTIVAYNVRDFRREAGWVISNDINAARESGIKVDYGDGSGPQRLPLHFDIQVPRPKQRHVHVSLELGAYKNRHNASKALDVILVYLRLRGHDVHWARCAQNDRATSCRFSVEIEHEFTLNKDREALLPILNTAAARLKIRPSFNIYALRENYFSHKAEGLIQFASPADIDILTRSEVFVCEGEVDGRTQLHEIRFVRYQDQIQPTSCATIGLYFGGSMAPEIGVIQQGLDRVMTTLRQFPSSKLWVSASVTEVRYSDDCRTILADVSDILTANALCEYPHIIDGKEVFFRPLWQWNEFTGARIAHIEAYNLSRSGIMHQRNEAGREQIINGLLPPTESTTVFVARPIPPKRKRSDQIVETPMYTAMRLEPRPADKLAELRMRQASFRKMIKQYRGVAEDVPHRARDNLKTALAKTTAEMEAMESAEIPAQPVPVLAEHASIDHTPSPPPMPTRYKIVDRPFRDPAVVALEKLQSRRIRFETQLRGFSGVAANAVHRARDNLQAALTSTIAEIEALTNTQTSPQSASANSAAPPFDQGQTGNTEQSAEGEPHPKRRPTQNPA